MIEDIYNLIYEKLDINDHKSINVLSKKFNEMVPLKNSTFIVNEISQIKKYIPYIKKFYITPGILDSNLYHHPFLIELDRSNDIKISDVISFSESSPTKIEITKLLQNNLILMQFYSKN